MDIDQLFMSKMATINGKTKVRHMLRCEVGAGTRSAYSGSFVHRMSLVCVRLTYIETFQNNVFAAETLSSSIGLCG